MVSHSQRRMPLRDKHASTRRRYRPNSSTTIACETLEHRELLSSLGHHMAGAADLRLGGTAHVREHGAHSHGHMMHAMSAGATTNTLSAPSTSTSTSSGTNMPVTSSAVGAQSMGSGSGWNYGGWQSTGNGASTNVAWMSGSSGVNPGGPIMGLTSGTALPGGINPGGPMIPANGTATALSSQAQTDLQKLQSDIQAIEAQSQVTVADLTAYATALKAITPPSGGALVGNHNGHADAPER